LTSLELSTRSVIPYLSQSVITVKRLYADIAQTDVC